MVTKIERILWWVLLTMLMLVSVTTLVGVAFGTQTTEEQPATIEVICDCDCLAEENDEPVEEIPEETIEETEPTEEVTEEPTDETVEETPEEVVNTRYLGQFTLTAYCHCEKCNGVWAYGPTATGTMPEAGRTIAVDPTVIPFGSEVVINGHTYVAEDSGSSIKGNRIDVFFDSHSEALEFGMQYAKVYIVED